MRRFYTTLACLVIGTAAMAQVAKVVPQVPASQRKAFDKIRRFDSTPAEEHTPEMRTTIQPNLDIDAIKKSAYQETVIGITRFDLQTNASVQNRIAKTGDWLSAGFTMSSQNVDYSDRGTGYNFFDGNVWDDWPTDRLESTRVGWPSVMHTGGGREVVITHDGTDALRMVWRDVNTDDDWVESEIPNPTGHNLLWPRAVTGGPDGNTIHLFCVTEPIANTGTTYMGLDGAIIYYRSTDQGETWEIEGEILDGMTSDDFVGFDGDSFSVFSRGDKVAFAAFNDLKDSFVMISEDNGDNWDQTILVDFPVDLYVLDTGIDLNNDAVADTIYNTDQSGTVFIDSGNTVHVFFGDMFYMDADLTDANFQYFPGTNGLSYWREDFDAPVTITGTPDLDQSGAIELADGTGALIPLYYISMSSQPQVGEDADGNLYLSWAGLTETHASTGDQNYRHIYLQKSEDGGDSWTDPVDATPDVDLDGFECVFASMAPVVDDKIHLIYQRDTEPGLHVRGDEDPADDNDIVYYCVTTDLVIEVGVLENYLQGELVTYPNPADGQVTIDGKDLMRAEIRILDASGRLVYTEMVRDERLHVNTGDLAPGMYTVTAIQPGGVRTAQLVVR